MSRPRIAVGQAGGPTAVMNASLLGFLEACPPEAEVYGVLGGFRGLVEDYLVRLPAGPSADRRLLFVPGAWLGAGRHPLSEEDLVRCVERLAARRVRALAMIGGNGTMWACARLEEAARRAGSKLAVAGIPKTVDNDLAGTDHAPGFPSAARYVAAMVRDVGADLEAMRGFEAVRVLETMGRNAGWLALSAGYLRREPQDPPHLIYVPERPFDPDSFLEEVEAAFRAHGFVVAVVSEGLIRRPPEEGLRKPVIGGVAPELARRVEESLGLPARGELLGMGQRSFVLATSSLDREEARELGNRAARLLLEGRSGLMPGLRRLPGARYGAEVEEVPLGRVAGAERPLPPGWVISPPGEVPGDFRGWLAPLVGEDLAPHPPPLGRRLLGGAARHGRENRKP